MHDTHMPPNFSAAKTPHIADRLEPGLVCFSAGGGCRLCNHAPNNAPGKGCVRDGCFVSSAWCDSLPNAGVVNAEVVLVISTSSNGVPGESKIAVVAIAACRGLPALPFWEASFVLTLALT